MGESTTARTNIHGAHMLDQTVQFLKRTASWLWCTQPRIRASPRQVLEEG